jgi:CubicO group peptidase (beta-lactamase class C family)
VNLDLVEDLGLRERIPGLAMVSVADAASELYRWTADGAPLRRANVMSITKSIESLLVGLLLEDGLLPSLDRPVVSVLPESLLRSARHPGCRQVTVRHVMSMTGGWDWLENGQFTRYWLSSDDPAAFTLRLPCRHRPGTRFKYSNFAAHLLSAVITHLAGDTAAYAASRLFAPAGIDGVHWPRLRDGRADGASNVEMPGSDLVRFGQLLLSLLDGPAPLGSFLREATTPHSPGGHPEHVPYGLLWWVEPTGPAAGFFASGYGGQRLHVLDEQRRVVAIIADPHTPRSRLPDMRTVMQLVARALPEMTA